MTILLKSASVGGGKKYREIMLALAEFSVCVRLSGAALSAGSWRSAYVLASYIAYLAIFQRPVVPSF